MKTVVIAIALALVMNVYTSGTASADGSIGNGNLEIYKGGQLAKKLSGQNAIEEGALLVCDGKCMIKSNGIALVAADQAKLAIRNEDKAFNLYLQEGYVNYTITNNARKIAFHTSQGTYTTADVIFNAGSNPVVRGHVQVTKDGKTEIGVEEGRLVFATADGMKTVDANHKIVLAVSEVPVGAPAAPAATGLSTGTKVLIGAGTAALVGGAIVVIENSETDHAPTPVASPST